MRHRLVNASNFGIQVKAVYVHEHVHARVYIYVEGIRALSPEATESLL